MNKKILLLGSAGMAGHVILSVLKEELSDYEIYDVAKNDEFVNPSKCLDVRDFNSLQTYIDLIQPRYIINCIGLLNKTAEDFPDEAVLFNSYLPHFLESKTKESVTKIIHISTDCVFSGEKGHYTENDFKDGVGFYAQTKSLGELNNNKDLTIRTSIIGPELKKNGIGLFNWFMSQRGNIRGYDRAIWSGVTTLELAKFIIQVIRKEDINGIVHLTNNKPISKYKLLVLLQKIFKRDDIVIIPDDHYTVDKSFINTRKDFQWEVPDYSTMIDEMKLWLENKNNLKY